MKIIKTLTVKDNMGWGVNLDGKVLDGVTEVEIWDTGSAYVKFVPSGYKVKNIDEVKKTVYITTPE